MKAAFAKIVKMAQGIRMNSIAIRFQIFRAILAAAAIFPAITSRASHAADEDLRYVQQFLLDEGIVFDGFKVDGVWDNPDRFALEAFILILQGDEGLAWQGQVNGIYDAQFSKHLQSELSQLDDSDATVGRLKRLVAALDKMVAADLVLAPYREVIQPPAAPVVYKPPGRDIARGVVLFYLNGLFWEWGDEGLLWVQEYLHEEVGINGSLRDKSHAKYLTNDAIEHAWLPSMIASIVGFCLSPFGFAAIFFSSLSKKNSDEAFKVGFCVEVGEGIISFFGEASTVGAANVEVLFLIAVTIGAGIVTGALCAAAARKGGSAWSCAKAEGWALLVAALLTFLFFLGS